MEEKIVKTDAVETKAPAADARGGAPRAFNPKKRFEARRKV
jgi:hypothetical protein